MDTPYILTIDQSTSGTKALLTDRSGMIAGKEAMSHAQLYPQPGWVEHDPLEIYGNVLAVVRKVLDTTGISPRQLAALTLTNQRETAVVWDRDTGLPVYNAIVWQCRRTAAFCSELKARGAEPVIRGKTGLVLDPYFSAGKFRWILDRLESEGRQLPAGGLMAGTIDSWLLWKLTGGAVHATDVTNASRTSLFNIHTRAWDEQLVELFGVQRLELPEVKSCNGTYGYTADPALFSERIPITCVIGDSQAALFGQLCHKPGLAKATYGTGTSVLMNIGSAPAAESERGLVTAVAWELDGRIDYALEGIIHCTGDCMRWVRDQLGLFTDYAEAERQASALGDNGGVYVVPAFVGLGAPYWSPQARAAVLGLNRGSDRRHIIRAALESIAYQVRDTVELMAAESGIRLEELQVDGGAAENRFLMQFQADLLHTQVRKPAVTELSAMGAAYVGGLAAGLWSSLEELGRLPQQPCIYVPQRDRDRTNRYYTGWKQAVAAVMSIEGSV